MRCGVVRLSEPARPLARWLCEVVASLYLRRPEMAELLAHRYRSLRSFVGGVLNEIAYRLGITRAPFLLSANLELSSRCNLRCAFCPTGNGTLVRARGNMDPTLARRVIAAGRPLEYVLLFQWGEPLLNPAFGALAKDARVAGARVFITTNGTLLDDRRVAALLDAGVERVTVSVDGDAETHEAVRGVPLARVEAGLRRLVAARDARRARTAVDVSMVIAPQTERAAPAFRSHFEGIVDRVQTIPVLTEGRRRTRCREPWRGGLVVLQDGRVTACCVDHEGVLDIGDARKDSLKDLWNSERMRALRRAHVRGDLPDVCARCTEYPSDAAAPRFSTRDEASRELPGRTRAAERARQREPVS